MLKQFFILPRDRDAQIHIRAQTIDIGFLQEFSIFSLDDQVIRLDIGRKRNIGLYLYDMRLDIFEAFLARYRNAMVAIQNEIDLADLVNVDRWQPHTGRVVNRGFDARPAFLIYIIARHKTAGEIRITPDAADNGLYRDFFHTALIADVQLELFRHFLVGKQLIRPAGETRQHLLHRGFGTCITEIVYGAFVVEIFRWHEVILM